MIKQSLLPKKPDEPIICINGELLPQSKAVIPVLDHGLLYGDGCFEAWCGRNGFIYELDPHLDRLKESLKALRISPKTTIEQMRSDIIKTVYHNALPDFYIKLIVTRGSSPHPVIDPRKCEEPNIIIFVRPTQQEVNADQKESGIRIKVLSTRRITHECFSPRIKSLNYLNIIMGKFEAWECGFDEAVMLDQQGYLTECPGFNIVFIKGNRLCTPSQGILVGITRGTVMDMGRNAGLEVETGFYTVHDLITADEIFLTNTVSGISPVTNVDGYSVGTGKPGKYAVNFAKTYSEWLSTGVNGTQCFPDAWK